MPSLNVYGDNYRAAIEVLVNESGKAPHAKRGHSPLKWLNCASALAIKLGCERRGEILAFEILPEVDSFIVSA